MAENSGIEWTHHTFNPWIGCQKVSPACDHCYAEAYDLRYNAGKHWGAKAERRRTSEKNWNLPVKWNNQAIVRNERYRVFCASLADVFDNAVPAAWREDLWALIRRTPRLDWLLLTKRPQNIRKMLPADWGAGYQNVQLGTTVENQTEAERRIPHLMDIPCAVRFLSCEPLLGPIDLQFIAQRPGDGGDHYINALEGTLWDDVNGGIEGVWEHEAKIDWVIAGGESGPQFRPTEEAWFRALRDQCRENDTAFLFKQFSGVSQHEIKKLGRVLDGVVHNEYPKPRGGSNA
ncbi:MAG: DUF5131 family protein [Bdellovibrionales bacterium]